MKISISKKERESTNTITRDIRYTLFRFSLLGMCLFCLAILFSYLVTRRPWINTATMISIIILCFVFYRFSRNHDRYTPSRIFLYILFTFIYLPFGFYTSPGSNSSMPGYILFIIYMETILAVNPWEYAFPLASMVVHIILIQSELIFPENFVPFESEKQRILDLSINYTMISLFIISVTVFVMRKYHMHSSMLQRISITDNLTGLYNRFFLEEKGEKELSRSLRTGDIMSLVFIDLNNFKKINDALGHQKGDGVLRDIGRIIKENTRDYDIAARFGGDEFVIVQPSTARDEADSQVLRLDRAFTEYSRTYERENFSVSFGVADSREGKTLSELLKRADKRLYAHKDNRKSLRHPDFDDDRQDR